MFFSAALLLVVVAAPLSGPTLGGILITALTIVGLLIGGIGIIASLLS